jgi:hypothetical protein
MTKDGQGTGDQVQSEMLAAVARYRSLEGERIFNHFLRNMLAASNKVIRDHGLVIAEDQQIADLEAHLHRARSEATAAAAYANHFGAALKRISKRGDVSVTLQAEVGEALDWTPEKGDKIIGAIGVLPGASKPSKQQSAG